MVDNLKLISVSEIFRNDFYEIPIYQRNYAWKVEHIEQLIYDIESAEDIYFLGNLIVNKKDNFLYEVIDGQQRLTTLYLLEKYLKVPFSVDSLKFEAREKSNKTLRHLCDEDFDEKFMSTEIVDGYRIIENYFLSNPSIDKDNFIKKLEDIKLVRIQVPEKIDLNHYFEIMNTRGEQLELHEIAKASILGNLQQNDMRVASEIWDSCADMDSYIQMNFTPLIRGKLFDDSWSNLKEEIRDFDSLSSLFNNENNDVSGINRQKLSEIIKNHTTKFNAYEENSLDSENSENERFESIISFPNFLLQVNAVIASLDEQDSSLDDINFLSNLEENWRDENSAKNFIFNLLKLRVLFDKYIIKREFLSSYEDSGKWSLKKIEKNTNNRSLKAIYKATINGDNSQLRTLQSALRVTYTSPKTMHWISYILKKLVDGTEINLINILEKYAIEKVINSDYKNATGFKFDRIIFTYLDYLIYRDSYTYQGKKIELEGNWQFQFRNSIEHFYPQNPSENEKWDYESLNSFGNLALITVSGNSKFSNTMPAGKVSTYSSVINQSWKLKIMYIMMEKNNMEWTKELSQIHKNQMFEILDRETKKF
ncbi:hypothetical protein BG262_03030 [Floricoccus penangensis]|uniref:DUF262 domain-containing protein n=1 Tax=Floricoccus penangensis TaxID=1859475 RepID=A0A9Q5JGI6_9LACT|nr:DUF262 domain-containing protein [Floricoccus penangensis]OFI46949.1 hypothetical protein BG262_03030 [Floricoccus penangensis]